MTKKPVKVGGKAENRPPVTSGSKGGKKLVTPPKSTKLSVIRIPAIKLETLRHIRDELGRVYREARCGLLDPSDLTKFSFALGELRKLVVDMDLEERIAALENKGE